MKNSKNYKLIQLLCPSFYPVIGGVETHILEIYSKLVKRDWKVTVYTSKNTLTKKNHLPEKDKIRGILVKRYPSNNFGFSPRIDWSKLNILVLHNFDFFTYSKIFLYSWFLKLIKHKNFSLIFVPHGGLIPARQWFSPLSFRIRKILYPTFATFLINRSVDGIQADSKWEEKNLTAMGIKSDLIQVIKNGIEDIAFSNVDKK